MIKIVTMSSFPIVIIRWAIELMILIPLHISRTPAHKLVLAMGLHRTLQISTQIKKGRLRQSRSRFLALMALIEVAISGVRQMQRKRQVKIEGWLLYSSAYSAASFSTTGCKIENVKLEPYNSVILA